MVARTEDPVKSWTSVDGAVALSGMKSKTVWPQLIATCNRNGLHEGMPINGEVRTATALFGNR
eukprot:scaffold15137_cov129-Isochrysis_galbana.AAC.2